MELLQYGQHWYNEKKIQERALQFIYNDFKGNIVNHV